MRGRRAAQRQAWEVLDVLDRAALWPEEAVPAPQTRQARKAIRAFPGPAEVGTLGKLP